MKADLTRSDRILRGITLTLRSILLLGFAIAIVRGHWQDAAATLGIAVITLLPSILGHRFHVRIPPEFEALAVIFAYASLFLGEVRGFYLRFWWWDVVLHTGSGFLLGILGFLLVHVLNEKAEIELSMKPGFVALFAFMFAIGAGAMWEIFEFAMDQLFGLNMQKGGLVDTMWDLIVDGAGALLISLFGWKYLLVAHSKSFLERWIESFIAANPRLFHEDGNDVE